MSVIIVCILLAAILLFVVEVSLAMLRPLPIQDHLPERSGEEDQNSVPAKSHFQ